MKPGLIFVAFLMAAAPVLTAQQLTLSEEGQKRKALHDYLFETFAEGRKTAYRGEGRSRGLKELTVLEKTTEIHDGTEILLPSGSERVAIFFRHFGFHGENLDRIKGVRVFPFSPDKVPPPILIH